jgi:hypothetical protein
MLNEVAVSVLFIASLVTQGTYPSTEQWSCSTQLSIASRHILITVSTKLLGKSLAKV